MAHVDVAAQWTRSRTRNLARSPARSPVSPANSTIETPRFLSALNYKQRASSVPQTGVIAARTCMKNAQEGIMHKSRLSAAAAGLFIATALIAAGGTSASAEELDPLAVVQSQGLLASSGGGAESASPPLKQQSETGATPTGEGQPTPVAIAPVTEAASVYDASADAAVVSESGYGFVTGTGVENTNASFIVIQDPSAPSSYDFEIGAPGTSLALNEDGTVTVSDANGQLLNYLMKPWAKDANGATLPTNYTVSGNIVTQHVDITGAAFPVVADPTTGCGVGWCSVYFDRSETKAIAAGGPVGGTALTTGCALLHPAAGAAYALISGAVVAVALGADANGNCVGVVGYGVGTLGGWNPFVENRGSSHCP